MSFADIDASALEQLRDNGVPVIDVRTDSEVARGVIPGARHIALDKLAARVGELDRTAPIILYCQSGARSAGAAQYLGSQGFRQVCHLQGGIIGWTATGRSLGNLATTI
jgi:rhodanese-related sulfurtransferase